MNQANKKMTIGDWQKRIKIWARSKGFTWKRAEIDTMLLRLHSEVSEAGEAARDKNRSLLGEELADIFIRLVSTAECMGIDLESAVKLKHFKNKRRPYLHGRARK